MPYNNITSRADAAALIPEEVADILIKRATDQSAALTMFRRVPVARAQVRVPVLSALPMALGISLAPRRLSGTVMSAGALGTAWLLSTYGAARHGSGAFVSLLLLGPTMDVALRHVRGGWRVYAALVLAGVVTNLLALGSRAASKLFGLDLAGARPFDTWWLQASGTQRWGRTRCGVRGIRGSWS